MHSSLVGSLDSLVDPEDESDPEETTDSHADANDDIAIAGRANPGRRIVSRRGGHTGRSGEWESGIDLRSELTLNASLVE